MCGNSVLSFGSPAEFRGMRRLRAGELGERRRRSVRRVWPSQRAAAEIAAMADEVVRVHRAADKGEYVRRKRAQKGARTRRSIHQAKDSTRERAAHARVPHCACVVCDANLLR